MRSSPTSLEIGLGIVANMAVYDRSTNRFFAFTSSILLPRQHGGGDEVANLALACSHCNLHKGPNWAGIDPGAGALISLFHPRRQQWSEHFHLPGIWINGSTDVGRATVRVLEMNESSRLELRENLRARGVLD